MAKNVYKKKTHLTENRYCGAVHLLYREAGAYVHAKQDGR